MSLRKLGFDWDRWNIQKNELKHGVAAVEAESAFADERHVLFRDNKHSTEKEERFVLYGRSMEDQILMIGFTLRRGKVRIITARPASQKERKVYEETQKQKKH